MTAAGPAAQEVGKTVTDVGRIFGSAGIDGLILYALLIGSLLLFLVLCLVLWLHSRERSRERELTNAQIESRTKAALDTAEAVKDLATAITSAASADMTFKQAMGQILVDCQGRLDKAGIPRRDQP